MNKEKELSNINAEGFTNIISFNKGFQEGKAQTIKRNDFDKREMEIILSCLKEELSFREKDASSCEMALREDYVFEMESLINKTKELLSSINNLGVENNSHIKCWCKKCGKELQTKREYIEQEDTCDECFKPKEKGLCKCGHTKEEHEEDGCFHIEMKSNIIHYTCECKRYEEQSQKDEEARGVEEMTTPTFTEIGNDCLDEAIKGKILDLRIRFGNDRSIKHLWKVNEFREEYPEWYLYEFGRYCLQEGTQSLKGYIKIENVEKNIDKLAKKWLDFFCCRTELGELNLIKEFIDNLTELKQGLKNG